jgi:hypothetical protein
MKGEKKQQQLSITFSYKLAISFIRRSTYSQLTRYANVDFALVYRWKLIDVGFALGERGRTANKRKTTASVFKTKVLPS